jgi:hypothetical protein
MEHLWLALEEAIGLLAQVAVRGGILAWGVFMGRLFATGFFKHPRTIKIVLISMPIMVLIAAFFAFYSFKFVVNPGETRLEAIQDAQVTFFLVLLPLWAGCIWGMISPIDGKGKNGMGVRGQ